MSYITLLTCLIAILAMSCIGAVTLFGNVWGIFVFLLPVFLIWNGYRKHLKAHG